VRQIPPTGRSLAPAALAAVASTVLAPVRHQHINEPFATSNWPQLKAASRPAASVEPPSARQLRSSGIRGPDEGRGTPVNRAPAALGGLLVSCLQLRAREGQGRDDRDRRLSTAVS
jgi:hypothetical protein